MTLKFKRQIEDFICEYCQTTVSGNGFTNHCPKCLYSKHVDIYPGDRNEVCQGLMSPVGIELKQGRYVIKHQCQKCGQFRNNESARNDEIDSFLASLL